MIALRFHNRGNVVRTEEPVPVPGAGDVLIRVAYCGICGTDLHIIDGEAPASENVILGHEFCGIIETTNGTRDGLEPGMPAAVDPNNFCGHCQPCRQGNVHFCEYLKPTGISYDGGWAEYCVVPERQVYPLPPQIPMEWGALIEPLSCIVHGWDRLQPLSNTADVLIMGSGLIGMLWGLVLRQHGFRSIHFSESNPARRSIAEGLDFQVETPGDIFPSAYRFDLVIDCSGNPSALESATGLAGPLGKILYFGICPEGQQIQLEPFQVFRKELTILGSVINPFSFSRAIGLIRDINIPLEQLGVSFFPLDDYTSALSLARAGSVTKAIFKMAD